MRFRAYVLAPENEDEPFFDKPDREAKAKEMGTKLFYIPILVNHSVTTIFKGL